MSHSTVRTSFAFLMVNLAGIPFLPAVTLADTPSTTVSSAIPDGTEVHLALMKDLKSGGNKAGEEIPFEVSQDVYSPGRALLISANTPAYGKVLQSSRRGMFGKGGKLKYTIDYILMPDKSRVILRSDPQLVRGGDNRTASIATAILLTPLTLFINGKDVSVNKGQVFTMYIAAPTPVTPSPPLAGTVPANKVADPIVPIVAPAAPAQSLFTFANGAQTVGTMISFDGSTYTVSTPKGMRQFKAAAIKSIQALDPSSITTSTAQR